MNNTITPAPDGRDFTVLPQGRADPTVVAGAIYDFAGWLTTRSSTIAVGAAADAAPMAELITGWAAARGLPLERADIEHWQRRLGTPARAAQEGRDR